MNKLVKIIRHPRIVLARILALLGGRFSDESYLKWMFRLRLGYNLDLDAPKTFNAKLQWLKLYDRKFEYRRLVDKAEVKSYIEQTIGGQYIIPTLGVYNSVDEIDFDKLPNQFVLKCTHDSGGVVICRDKDTFDKEQAKSRLRKGLATNYYKSNREWPYKALTPRIIAEQYMVDESGVELKDYKFFCFNGQAKIFKVDFDRLIEHRANYYDRNAQLLPFGEAAYSPDFSRKLQLPNNWEEMLILAEKVSNNNPFMRVDLYNINGKIYFGEITFFPAAGFGRFYPEEWDYTLGSWITLPNKKLYRD